MNSSREMTIILDRTYSTLDKKSKTKINKIITCANKPVQAPNNFPKIIRKAIKQTAQLEQTKISQETYYDEFLSELDTSLEFIPSDHYKPISPTMTQRIFSNEKNNDIKGEIIENYYYPNFDLNKDKDYITLNSYKKYLSGTKRPSIIRMRNLLKYFEETANIPDPRKYNDDFPNINYLKNYNHFLYHQTLFNNIKQEIDYIFKIILDSLNCFEKTSQIISELLHTQNILDDNIIWMNHFSKLNDIALEKLDFAQKILHFEKIKPTDISKINLTNKDHFFKKINHYMEETQSPIFNDILTDKPVDTIIGYSIDQFFLEKYYDITSPSWIPVQINETNFVYLTSIKSVLDFIQEMPSKIKATKDLINMSGFILKK